MNLKILILTAILGTTSLASARPSRKEARRDRIERRVERQERRERLERMERRERKRRERIREAEERWARMPPAKREQILGEIRKAQECGCFGCAVPSVYF